MGSQFTIGEGEGSRRFLSQTWRGKDYRRQPFRILVHGDSPYATDGLNSMDGWLRSTPDELMRANIQLVKDAIEAYGNPGTKWNSLVWPAVVKVALGQMEEPAGAQFQEVFNRIAFNNYVHAPMAASYCRPTAGQIAVAKEAYLQDLAELRPHLSIVLAKRVWNQLPTTGRHYCSALVGLKRRDMWVYTSSGHETLVGWLRHPSTVYRKSGWRNETEIEFAREYVRIASEFREAK
ncbi:MAG: hypothetical protein ABI972_08900 [Acidobacteriota bacterium]